MARFRLRSKLVLSLIFTTAVLTGASLLSVQNYLGRHAREEIREQLSSALGTYELYAQQRQKMLLQSAALSADLPIIRSLMTTNHAPTIQDSSADFWRLTESDLFLLADPAGKVMALHPSGGFDRDAAAGALTATLEQGRSRDWWLGSGRLYEVYLQPIYNGDPEYGVLLGILAAGFAVDEGYAADIAEITSSDVALRYGQTTVASSLSGALQQELSAQDDPATEIRLGGENFFGASVELAPTGARPVTLSVLKSYDAATLFLRNVNRLLMGIGLVALVSGSLVMFLIAHTLTRPLARLASGVTALERGDFTYPLKLEGRDEVAELTAAFDTMRKSLKEHQQHLLHAERLATIGRMASTISHDLRHPLTTILAYAELLSESSLDDRQRGDMYRQIRMSVNNMADLIASLLEFSGAQEALQLTYGDCVDTLEDTIRAVRLKPEFCKIQLTLLHEGPTHGWFDFAKLDRAFHNLLRNAFEAVAPESGRVRVAALGSDYRVEISISDNGPGIPEGIRDEIFQPFVTLGKSDGTGLGLAVVQKVVRDHRGDVTVESTGPHGTTFVLTLPVVPRAQPTVV